MVNKEEDKSNEIYVGNDPALTSLGSLSFIKPETSINTSFISKLLVSWPVKYVFLPEHANNAIKLVWILD